MCTSVRCWRRPLPSPRPSRAPGSPRPSARSPSGPGGHRRGAQQRQRPQPHLPDHRADPDLGVRDAVRPSAGGARAGARTAALGRGGRPTGGAAAVARAARPTAARQCLPAAEADAQIGGDLYAAARTAHGTRLIIGDVRGKGLEAVGDAALVLGAFRAAAHQESDLPGLVTYLERAVAPDLANSPTPDDETGGEAFITAALLDVPDHEQTLHLVSCGHPPPLLLRGNRAVSLDVDHPAPPLGLADLTEDQLTAQCFPFEPGDIVLLYADGVLEARDEEGRFHPLAQPATAWRGVGPHYLLRHLREDLLAHTATRTLGDDDAMVAIERLPPPSSQP
ncbi:PP2C family protein-serine/threonine phosphatase [Streptomyces sp. NPDC052000]|uniref:PP2C family protein-serine/threonine phosphatase n=1 Tax=Streptomyces sp. NPDC052000 TaxID=3155676 RepID=UPI00344E10F4